MITEIHPARDLSPADRRAADALDAAAFVLPPDDPAHAMQWSNPDGIALARDDDGRVMGLVAVVHRDGTLDGVPVRLAGIGGVASDPAARGRGFAMAALRQALEAVDARDPDLTMLICVPPLFPFYGRLGFVPFAGTVHVEQHGERVLLDYAPAMIRPGRLPVPAAGDLDLRGRPW